MQKSSIIAIIAIVVVLVIIGMIWQGSGTDNGDENSDTVTPGDNNGNTSTDTNNGAAGGIEPVMREFTVTGRPFSFSPAELRAKEGDTVRLTFVNEAGTHDFKIDELGVATKVLEAGQSETVEFTVDQKGTYEYYCSVGTHRQMGMRGNLIVE